MLRFRHNDLYWNVNNSSRHDLLQLQNVLGQKQFLMGGNPTKEVSFDFFGMPKRHMIICDSILLPNYCRTRIHDLLESKEMSALKEYLERDVVRRWLQKQDMNPANTTETHEPYVDHVSARYICFFVTIKCNTDFFASTERESSSINKNILV